MNHFTKRSGYRAPSSSLYHTAFCCYVYRYAIVASKTWLYDRWVFVTHQILQYGLMNFMNTEQPKNRVEVIDRDGWRKDYALDKAILHIGSDSRNDIVLEATRGAGIEARHAQLIAASAGRGYRLVNLGQNPITLPGQGMVVPPRSSADLFDGDVMQIGDHTFRFFIAQGVSQTISLSFRLSDTMLTVDAQLEGIVTVQNLGNAPGVQFKLSVEGLTPAWYELGPGPILFPGAQKDVPIRLRHALDPTIPAGRRTVTVRATASAAYPGESAVVSQTIQIAPYRKHSVRLIPV